MHRETLSGKGLCGTAAVAAALPAGAPALPVGAPALPVGAPVLPAVAPADAPAAASGR